MEIQNSPLSLSEILDRVFTIYRSRFAVVIGICAIPNVASYAAGLVFQFTFGPNSQGTPQTPSAATLVTALAIAFPVILISVGATLLAQAAVSLTAWRIQVGQTATVWGAYQAALKHTFTLLGAGILAGVAVALGLLLLIVPGIIVSLAFSMTTLIILVEGEGVMDSLRRSWDLTKGNRGRIFVAGLICGLLSWALAFAFQWPALALVALTKSHNPPLWANLATGISSTIGNILAMPFFAIALALIYYDARRQKEGLDVQMLLDKLPDTAAPTSAPAIG
jgi:hypothetical protein